MTGYVQMKDDSLDESLVDAFGNDKPAAKKQQPVNTCATIFKDFCSTTGSCIGQTFGRKMNNIPQKSFFGLSIALVVLTVSSISVDIIGSECRSERAYAKIGLKTCILVGVTGLCGVFATLTKRRVLVIMFSFLSVLAVIPGFLLSVFGATFVMDVINDIKSAAFDAREEQRRADYYNKHVTDGYDNQHGRFGHHNQYGRDRYDNGFQKHYYHYECGHTADLAFYGCYIGFGFAIIVLSIVSAVLTVKALKKDAKLKMERNTEFLVSDAEPVVKVLVQPNLLA